MARTTVDAVALRELVHLLVATPPRQAVGEPAVPDGEVLRWLKELIPCENVVYNDYATRHWPDSAYADTAGTPEGPDEDDVDAIWRAHYWTSFCSHHDRMADYQTVIILTDLCTVRTWRNSPMVVELNTTSWRDGYFERDLMIPVPGRPGRSRRFRFERGPGRDFDDTDRAVAVLLRPLLVDYVHALDLVSQATAPLTARQRQLMSFVAAGYSNDQVARTLGITAATVRTHLQQIYARLGVSSRSEAAARVHWSDGRVLLRSGLEQDVG